MIMTRRKKERDREREREGEGEKGGSDLLCLFTLFPSLSFFLSNLSRSLACLFVDLFVSAATCALSAKRKHTILDT